MGLFILLSHACYVKSTKQIDYGYMDTRTQVYSDIPDAEKLLYVTMGGNYAHNRKSVNELVYTFLNSVPRGRIKLFHNEKRNLDDLRSFVGEFKQSQIKLVKCPELVNPYVSTRFTCYLNELKMEKQNTKLGLVDTNDVTFQGDVFDLMEYEKVYLVQEPETFPMVKCPWHKRWIQGCKAYGETIFEAIKYNSMICAGTIFGGKEGMENFLDIFTRELKQTKCNDQGTLNVLYYTGELDNVILWPHEKRIVMSMNVARKPTDFKGAMVVHTGDNAKAVNAVEPVIFKNVLDVFQEAESRRLLTLVDFALGDNYVIDGGTLVGAALDNKRIPWDDDMDIYIIDEFRENATKLLQGMGLSVFPSYNNLYLKVWDPRGTQVNNRQKHNWPFIDIGLLVQNETHIWEKRIKESKYSHHIYRKEWMFPPTRMMYEGIHARVPRDYNAFLNHRFGHKWAKQDVFANWDHRLERTRYPKLGNGNFKITRERDN